MVQPVSQEEALTQQLDLRVAIIRNHPREEQRQAAKVAHDEIFQQMKKYGNEEEARRVADLFHVRLLQSLGLA